MYKNLTFLLFGLVSQLLFSQLSTRHWISPIHSRQSSEVEDHYVYLSTPREIPFNVTITDGSETPLSGTLVTISKGNPARVLIGNGVTSSPMFVTANELNSNQSNKGLILTAESAFYVSFRIRSENQAGYLTSKGMLGEGTRFRLGSFPQKLENNLRNFYASVMATEDNTTIMFSDYDTRIEFTNGTGTIGPDSITIPLNKGETYTVSGYTDVVANREGFVGALVTSDKPITVNTGNALGSIASFRGQDYGIDQIVPEEIVGQEYILIEGGGSSDHERAIVIATENNTEIFVNGANTPVATINAGQFYEVDNSFYQGVSHRNLHLFMSKPAYVYQGLAGSTANTTSGMNFLPPLNCLLLSEVDLIADVDRIGEVNYFGAIIAITRKGSILSINGSPVLQTPENVLGTDDWETYRIGGLRNNVTVSSTGPLSVGVFGFNGAAGFGGYYSGFGFGADEVEIFLCDNDGKINVLNRLPGGLLSGGIWTPPFVGGGNIFDTTIDTPGTYNYSLINDCAPIDVDITINTNPEPLINSPLQGLNLCANTSLSSNIDLSNVEIDLLDSRNPNDFFISFFSSLTDAENDTNEIVNLIFEEITATSAVYYAKLTAKSTFCSSIAPFTITLIDAPIANAGPDKRLSCINPTINLDASSSSGLGTLSYSWTTTNGNIVSGANTSNPEVNQEGTYTVQITSTSSGLMCSETDTVIVNPAPIPIANAGNDIALLCNDIVILNGANSRNIFGTTSGISYLWTGPGTITNTNSPFPTVNAIGTYNLEITFIDATGNRCTNNDTVIVAPPNPITPPLLIDLILCDNSDRIDGNNKAIFDLTTNTSNSIANLDASLFSVTYFTSFIDADTNSNPILNPSTYENISNPQSIFARTSNPSGSCVAITRFEIIVSGPPLISTRIETNDFESNNSIFVEAIGLGNYQYAIRSTENEISIENQFQDNPVFRNILPNEYEIFVNDLNGCGSTSEIITIYGIPSFFSPNGDGINDFWKIRGKESNLENAEVFIFNRFGKLLKQITDLNTGWDGNYIGQALPSSEYWYAINLKDGRSFKGHFTLKR